MSAGTSPPGLAAARNPQTAHQDELECARLGDGLRCRITSTRHLSRTGRVRRTYLEEDDLQEECNGRADGGPGGDGTPRHRPHEAVRVDRLGRAAQCENRFAPICYVVRFGSQIDAQPVTNRVGGTDDRDGIAGRRVAGYLAKYVTKSAADFGLGTHRVSPHAIATLPVCEHVRRILHTIAELARRPGRAIMLTWLHCLGFRGHITTKTRRYSTTLQALRARRFRWQTMRNHLPAELDQPAHIKADDDEPVLWEFRGCGHATNGERLLVLTAALGARQRRQAARDALTDTPPPEASP
jgi:hypothetical protein